MSNSPNYFFSAPDADFKIKGSRDPLGFQVIWQKVGNRIIPHLSTVSNNILDFQILCLGHYFFGNPLENSNFKNSFIKFEQLCAYARYKKSKKLGFNGVEKVRARMQQDDMEISRSQSILTNQIAYGVWGKYIRPLREVGVSGNLERIDELYEGKIKGIEDGDEIRKWVAKCEGNKLFKIKNKKETFKPFMELLELNDSEKEFFRNTLLGNKYKDHHQNELYGILLKHPDILDFKEDAGSYNSLYAQLERLKSKSGNEGFIHDLELIINVEKVLAPLNRIFRLLQNEHNWSRESVEDSKEITEWKGGVDYHFVDDEWARLNEILKESSNWELVSQLVERNKWITSRRKAKPWMEIDGDYLRVYHREGARNLDFDKNIDSDNNYFLFTYLNIFKQLPYT